MTGPLSEFQSGYQTARNLLEGSSHIPTTVKDSQNFSAILSQEYIKTPKGQQGIAGFVFDYEGDNTLELRAEITPHFAEDNSNIEDHMSLHPRTLTLSGKVSELIMPAPFNLASPSASFLSSGLTGVFQTLPQKLGTLNAYLGKYTPQAAQKVFGQVNKVENTLNNYVNTATQYLNQVKSFAGVFGIGAGQETKQSKAYAFLAALYDARVVFDVVTPWTYQKNYVISSVSFFQPKETPSQTEITVIMKQIRMVSVNSFTNPTPPNSSLSPSQALKANQGAQAFTSQAPQYNGSATGTPIPFSALNYGPSL